MNTKKHHALVCEVRNLVHLGLTGDPYNPDSIHREKFLSDFLSEELGNFMLADYSLDEIRGIFASHITPAQFDLDQWLSEKEAEGIFDFS